MDTNNLIIITIILKIIIAAISFLSYMRDPCYFIFKIKNIFHALLYTTIVIVLFEGLLLLSKWVIHIWA